MNLDINIDRIKEAAKIAGKYYDNKTFNHVVRVVDYVVKNPAIPIYLQEDCVCLAYMHDLLEDTNYDPKDLPLYFRKALEKISKPKNMNYDEYCQLIHDSTDTDWGKCAWFVKLADIKDHLSQVDTLTPRLKEKYLSGLRYLL